jgi:MFS transporter, ACS family, D-galactonate transporter
MLTGVLGGVMNFCTTAFSVASTILIGVIVQETGSYFYVLTYFGANGLLLFLCSMAIRYRRPARVGVALA